LLHQHRLFRPRSLPRGVAPQQQGGGRHDPQGDDAGGRQADVLPRVSGGATMRKSIRIGFSLSLSVAVLVAGLSISAQAKDKHNVKVPHGPGFAEFRGYEDWAVISISANGGKFAVIMGKPVMIDAYKQGIPANGKPFPDGARMAKIHWDPKKQEAYPGQPT